MDSITPVDPAHIPNASPRVAAAARVLLGMGAGRTYEDLCAAITDDFTQTVHPLSLGVPKLQKEQFARFTKDTWKTMEFQIYHITETPDRVVMHVTSEGKTQGDAIFPNENLITFGLAPDPNAERAFKVSFMREFVDSKTISELVAKHSMTVG